jgi:DNA adenine methylase
MEFKKEDLIKSPLNYTGGKFKLLPQILPLFPDNIDTFVDLFAGGLNVKANKIVANDYMKPLVDLYSAWKKTNIDDIYIPIYSTELKSLTYQKLIKKVI